MSLYIDLTGFLVNPIKTGIQRIAGELCRFLPPDAAIPVRLDTGRYVALPTALISAIGRYFDDADESSRLEIGRLAAEASPIEVSSEETVLIPEIFGEERAPFFRRMSEWQLRRCRFIIYDLLPATHPEYFLPDMPVVMAGYYQIIGRATSCGFISAHTRDVYYGRLKRTNARGGVVLPLGSDSLGPRAQRPTLSRPLTFTVLGTIEPRKNHALILEAFEPLLRQIDGLSLSFIGKIGCVDAEFAQKVQAFASDTSSGLRFLSAPDDGAIRRHLEQSRATIYVSAAEGYGLPPVESLWVGTPVIASVMVPSLECLGSAGIHYVDPLTVVNLRRAILAFLDDGYANWKTEETMHLNLPTWHSFGQEVLRWCGQE